VKFDFLFVVFVSGFWALNFEVELTPYPSLFFQLIAKADLLFSVVSVMDSFMFLFLKNNGVRKLEAVFAAIIATMALSFADTKPNGKELLII
jgi:hypothetical protein